MTVDDTRAPSQPPATEDPLLDPHTFDLFLDANFRAAAAQMFRACNDRDGLTMLQYGYKKTRSGELQAIQKLVAGDGAGAIALWNKIDDRNRRHTATKLADGKWLIKLTDCEPYTLDPAELRAWLEQLHRILLLVSVKPAASPLQ
jgi:hypothetical protein